jgi:hypothetical protein
MDNGQTNMIITGPPRSGTTLVCYLLNKLPNIVALHEPMNLNMFSDPSNIIPITEGFFKEMRTIIDTEKKALSRLSEGKIPTNPFDEGKSNRNPNVQKGLFEIDKELSPDFKLCIKHNAHFTFTLDALSSHFLCYVVIRDPLITLASWNSIKAPVSEGRVKVLYRINPQLAEKLDQMPDIIDRQIELLDLHFQQYVKFESRIQLIKYEDIIETNGRELMLIDPSATQLNESLESKNRIDRYDEILVKKILDRLLERDASFWRYYPKEAFMEYWYEQLIKNN